MSYDAQRLSSPARGSGRSPLYRVGCNDGLARSGLAGGWLLKGKKVSIWIARDKPAGAPVSGLWREQRKTLAIELGVPSIDVGDAQMNPWPRAVDAV